MATEEVEKIKCSTCDKDKLPSSYKLGWQLRNKICDYCAMFRSVSIYGNPIKSTVIKRCCLRCDKSFVTNTANRICGDCKDKEEYRIGSYFTDMVAGVSN